MIKKFTGQKRRGYLRVASFKPTAHSVKLGINISAGLLGALFLVTMAVIVLFDINTYRLRVKAAASEALGMDVSVNGRLSLGFSPGLYLALSHLHIRNRGVGVTTAPQARLGIDLLPLLKQQVRINSIWLDEPIISIVHDLKGNFNFENPELEVHILAPLNIPEISFNDGTLRYFDARTELLLEATGCNLAAEDMALAGGQTTDAFKHLSLTGNLDCENFRKNDFSGTKLKTRVNISEGRYELNPLKMTLFGGVGNGKVLARLQNETPQYELEYILSGLHTEDFFLAFTGVPMLEGLMDFNIGLAATGSTHHQILNSAIGEFALTAGKLTLHGSDLDSQLARFEASQDFDLIDAGAFFFIGPLGLLASKGYDFTRVLNDSGGSSKIEILVSDWKVTNGLAEAKDVAMATDQHRLALRGQLDFVNEQFRDVTLAAIDGAGCAIVQQRITGSFQTPIIQNPGMVKTLTSPIRSLFKQGIELLTDLDCEVFYSGSVAAPKVPLSQMASTSNKQKLK